MGFKICSLLLCFVLNFLGSWEELILQLAGGITEHGQASSKDELALADIIDCIRWEMASIFQIPGRSIFVDLDLRSVRHYTLHLDFGNAIMEGNSMDPWNVLGQSTLCLCLFRIHF